MMLLIKSAILAKERMTKNITVFARDQESALTIEGITK